MSRKEKPFRLDVVSIRLVKDAPLCSNAPIHSPQDAVAIVGKHLCQMDREVLCVINLRTDGTPINCTFASTGGLNECIAEPRELFKASILSNAASMILVHNHPSGSLNPSKSDTTTTDRMIKLCAMMQIPLLDHIIVGGDNSRYFSFREHGKMNMVMPTLETNYQQINFDNILIDEPSVVREAESLNYEVIPVKEKIVKIPPITVDPDVIFHEDEMPEEAKLYMSQTQAAKEAWENIFKDPDHVLQALHFKTSGKYPQNIIISPSVREGVDWQVSYFDYTDEATSHSDCNETEHYKQSPRGLSLLSLYSELSAYSLHGHEVSVTVSYKDKERNIPMTNEREQFISDIATLDWLNGKNSEKSSLYKTYKEQFGEEYQIYSKAWDHAEAHRESISFAILTSERGRGEKEIAYIETRAEMPFDMPAALEDLYAKINMGQPDNYYGHTVSVGDHIAVIRHGQVNSVWSVEPFGFERIPRPEWGVSDEKINALKLSMDIRQEFKLRRRIRDYAIASGNEALLHEVIRDTRLNEIEHTYDFIFKLADERAKMGLELIYPEVAEERKGEEMAEKGNTAQDVGQKLISHDSTGIRVEGHRGTWYVIETDTIEGKELFLLESEQYGDEAAGLIVDKDGNLVLEDVWNGFYDYRDEVIEPLSERIIEAMEAAGYSYDDIEGGEGYRHFNGEYGTSMTFDTWADAAEWLDGVVFDDPEVSDRVEQIMHPERFEVTPVAPGKAEDVTNLKLIESEAGPHWRVHTFSCDVNGVSDTLTYLIQYHDDGEDGFTLHTVKNDIWDNLSRSELVRLERIVSSELNYQLWEKKILEAKTADELQDIRLSYMETENLNLSEDQMNRFWAVYDAREAELSTISLLDLITNVPLMDRVTEAMALAGYRIEQSADGIVRLTNERATDTLTFRSWSEAFDWIEYPGFNEEDYAIINGLDIKDRMTRVTLADVQPDPTVSITDMMNYGYMDDLYGNMLPMRGDRAKQFLSSGAEIYALYPDNTKRRITEATDPSFAAENQMFGIFGSELDRLMLREKVKLALKYMGHDLTDKDVELGIEVYSAQNGGIFSTYRADDVATFITKDTVNTPAEKQSEEKIMVTVQSASRSNFHGYVVLAQYDRNGTGDDQQIYLGKAENYDSNGNYDNSDNSLTFVSTNRKMFSFLDSGAGWTISQQGMIDNGTFSPADYAEYASLSKRLEGMGLAKLQEKKFGINVNEGRYEGGVEFSYPEWDRQVKESTQKQRLFVDMDGTLAVFRQVDTLETLYEEGYFLNLEPHTNVVAAVKEIIQNNPEIEVYTLSAVLSDSRYALEEKNAWLDKYLPEIDAKHRVFVPCGSDKKLGIEGGVRANDFLLDDYTKNLIDWEPPGRGIKLLNAINHSRGTWKNDRIRYDREPGALANGIISVMETDQHIYDDRVAEMSLMENMQQRRERWYNEAQADMQAGNMEKYQASMARVDEVDRAMEALKNNEAPEAVLEKRKSQCERQMKKYTRDGIPELAQEWLGRWNEVRRTIELLEKEKEQTKEAVLEEQKENEQPMEEVVEEFDQIAENLAMNFTASELETELDARDDTSVPGLQDESLSGYSSASIRKALSLMAENFPEKEMILPEQDKIMVAIENTDDYAETGFHQNLVDDDIQNEDGSYGRVVDKYRIVTLGEDGRIVPYDAEIFDSREEAFSAIDGHPRLNIVSYDDLVHEAERAIDRHEAEFGADGTRAFPHLNDEQYTFQQLVDIMMDNGVNLADVAIGRMMDQIEEETGKWPDWNDITPEWVVNVALRGGRSREEVQPKQENNMNEKKIIPINEITDGNGRALAGDQILRAAVYNAVKEFQDNNNLPDYLKVLDENGQYEDKDFLYSGYDEYVALSHMDELKPYADRLAPHIEAFRAARTDLRIREEHVLLPLLAEVYYGKQNGMTEPQIDFMLSKLGDRALSDTLRHIRQGFEDGLTEREINIFTGEEYYVQEYLREYIAGGGDLEKAEALKGSDMNTAYFVLNAYREDNLSAEKGKAVVQAMNQIRSWNVNDFAEQKVRGMDRPDYRFHGLDYEWFAEYLTDLAKDDRVTPEVLSSIAGGFVAQRNTDAIQDFVRNYGGVEEFLAEDEWRKGKRSLEGYAGNERYRFFYAGEQNKEAEDFQKATGYHKIWASDLQGVNGDTWIVYRSVEDLPAWLQDYAREEEAKENSSFIADYYVVEDIQKRGALDSQRFNDLDSALKAYVELPSEKMKALGITNTNRLPGSLDLVHCRDGVDTVIEDYKKVPGWDNPEITGALGRIAEALEKMKEEKTVDDRMVETNIGKMPIEDYREIFAHQHGFDSYEDMYKQGGRIGNGYDKEDAPRGEDNPNPSEQPPAEEKEKSAKDKLADQLQQGVKKLMNTEQFKNWLDTASHLFYNNYSINNAILVWLQKPDASYTMGFEQWKEYGRVPVGKGTGIQIFVPVMAYEKSEGAFFRMIKNSLQKQLQDVPDATSATHRVGMSKFEFTMNRNGMMGVIVDGKEAGIHTETEIKRLINTRILGKVPMYFTAGTVFDAKDTAIPEYLWVKKGFTKDEMVRDDNGKAIKNKKGEYKIINTPERQAKFQTTLDMSMEEKDPEKMATLFEALKSVSERNGIPVFVKNREDDETLKGGADGYFSRETSNECPKGYIVMPSDLEPTKMCAVMLHEMGHSDLHGKLGKLEAEMGEKFISRKMREVQAEAIAYMTGKHFGIETDTSSFSYIAAYSNGFELQDFQKSIDVIYKECQKLYKEIGAELDVRGLNMDLTEKPKTQLEKDTVETLCDKYTLFALEQEDRLAQIQKELPSLAAENKQYPELLDVVKKQKVVSDCQLVEVKLIQIEAEKLKKAETRPEQDACLENISAAQGRLAQETEKFNELSHSFLSISKVCKSGLKEEWSKNPQKAIESMKGTYPQLNNLSKTQVEYITKSRYIDKEYVPMLRNNPQAFVENACSRAEQLDKVVGKNGAFVEVNFCEQWTDQPIVRDGALMHPKVADSIVKQGEVQIMSLRTEAEQSGEYFPYSKCDVTIYALESKGRNEKNLVAYNTRVDIGDGTQKSLSDHLHQTCGKGSVIVEAFDKASRERGAKEKILFNEAPERVQQDKAKTQTNSDKNFSHAEVGKELDRIRAEKGRADEDRSPRGKGANVKSDDERML